MTSYTLFRNITTNAIGATRVTGVSVNITNYNNIGLTSGTTYYYWLKAYNIAGSSVFSPIISSSSLPHTPQWVSATSVATNQINLSWYYLSSATSYTLFRNTVNNTVGAIKVIGLSADITNYNDIGLKPDTTYYYWVISYSSYSHSPFSPVISTRTFVLPSLNNLNNVIIGPNPFKPNAQNNVVTFYNLTEAEIKIYTITGLLVVDLKKNDTKLAIPGMARWTWESITSRNIYL